MKIQKLLYLTFGILIFSNTVFASIVTISGSLTPLDATLFTSTPGYKPGEGKCELTWTSSLTPNITDQLIYVDDGVTITEIHVPFIGPGLDNRILPLSPTELTGLTPGWTYTLTHVSEAGSLFSNGVWSFCTPATALPTPVLDPLPTPCGTNKTVSWSIGPLGGPLTRCQVTASLVNLNADPAGDPANDIYSGWVDCSSGTGSATLTPLTTGKTYYYHVQATNDPANPPTSGFSAYSSVLSAYQASCGGGGGGPNPYCGDGIINSANEECDDGNNVLGDGCDLACKLEEEGVCGNNKVETGEDCDDGNVLNGDGCSSICENEEIVTVNFILKGKPEYRTPMPTHPNLGLNALLAFYKPSIGSLTAGSVVLNNNGEGTYTAEIVTGTYDIGLNGEAHNTKVIRGIDITTSTKTVTLDYTFADTWELTAGDTVDNNKVDAQDMAKLIAGYKATGGINDLNKAGGVNALDIAILIWNYKLQGDPLGGGTAA